MSELSARMAKANKLMEAIIAAGGTSETAAMMNDEQWKMAERITRTKPASSETRAMVIQFIKIREEVNATPVEVLFERMKG
jgi:hypothetical protein